MIHSALARIEALELRVAALEGQSPPINRGRPASLASARLSKLRSLPDPFTAATAAAHLGLSPDAGTRWVAYALTRGWLRRPSRGRYTVAP